MADRDLARGALSVMTLQEIIALYRAQADDEQLDHLCSDELLAIYANEAQEEACRRSELLRDSSSPMCAVAFAADAESVPLDQKIVLVLRARIDGHPVVMLSEDEMECRYGGAWMDDSTRSRPTHLVSGMTTGRLHLWPRPGDAGTLRLTVQRLPLKSLANDFDKPEIRPELHRGLIDWMLFRSFSRFDTELFNEQRAGFALDRFEAEFGRRSSGRNEQWVRNGQAIMPGPIA